MAKVKKEWSDLVVLLLVFLIVATNMYWALAVRDLEDRLDAQAVEIFKLSQKVKD